jgi:DNA helicase-2/ATP-dependent DNA helicase PcrA
VGITRAKERLILTHAAERRLYGHSQANLISRFVRDIPEEAMEMAAGKPIDEYAGRGHARWNAVAVSSGGIEKSEAYADPKQPARVGAGDRYYKGAVVRHGKFGLGTVQRSDGAGDDLKISVSFPGHGVKTLSVKYANLEVI